MTVHICSYKEERC